jgi:signal transduction histidine kinase
MRTNSGAYESRIRTVLLGVLLASLVIQAGTSILLHQTRAALEAEFVQPLYISLNDESQRPPKDSLSGMWQRRRGLELRQQFLLRDTSSPAVAAVWNLIPPSAKRQILAGDVARVRREHDGALEIRMLRLTGESEPKSVVGVARDLPTYGRFLVIERWNTGFRTLGLVVLVGAVFLFTRELVRPFRRLRTMAADAQASLKMGRPPSSEEWEEVISTFTETVSRLKASQAQLEQRFAFSEAERHRLDDLNTQIIDAMPSGLVAADGEGRIIQANPCVETLPGLRRPESGESLVKFFAPYGGLRGLFSQPAGQARNSESGECVLVRDGESYFVGYDVVPVAHGGVLIVLDDRTPLRRLEALLAQRARLAALGETAAGLAHELRNAMAAIVGYARLMSKLGPDGACEVSTRIVREAGDMEAMLRRFLEVAKPVAIERVSVDVSEIVVETSRRFEHRFKEAGVTLGLSVRDRFREWIDPVWFKQALTNLLENALQHVPRGGQVCVTLHSSSDEWRVSVADSGPGVPRESREKVFAPFVSLRPGGTGLGLALVQKIMTAHDGRIELSDSPLGGAEFSLTFPHHPSRVVTAADAVRV